jgi:hypothetical protein
MDKITKIKELLANSPIEADLKEVILNAIPNMPKH